MNSQTFYLLRFKQNGQHLAARPDGESSSRTFLLVFTADHEALSYLSTHAPAARDRFAVDAIATSQIKPLLTRWGFTGVGIVSDPFIPVVEFMQTDSLRGF